jgi:hypothetical protein
MRKLFHVEPILKTLFNRGFLVFITVAFLATSCITQRHTVEIQNYILLQKGKVVLGHPEGLTAFMFENSPRKIPFSQFVADKYQLPKYNDIEYTVDVDGNRFKVYVYENAEIEKYFDTSEFMVTKQENEANIKGSTAKFIALSMTDANNQDCLAENSLFKNIATKYLVQLKDEYNNL